MNAELNLDTLFNGKQIWLILGAGISRSFPSQVPLWSEMKNDTIEHILDILQENKERHWPDLPDYYQFETAKNLLQKAICIPEVVLECLCDVYLESRIKERLTDLIQPKEKLPRPNDCHAGIAAFVGKYKVQGIITTNYDTLLETAMWNYGCFWHHVTPGSSVEGGFDTPIFKVHGTIEDPSSLVFIRDMYYKGLPVRMADHLLKTIRNSTLVICGYSGNDYDLFPICRRLIAKPQYNNQAILIDPSQPIENSPYASLKQKIIHYPCTGESFFADLVQTSAGPSQAGPSRLEAPATLLPHEDPCDCALFVAKACLSVQKYQDAIQYYNLAEDIAADRQEEYGRGIACLGRSMCCFRARMNCDAAREFVWGLDWLRKANLEEIRSPLGPHGENLRMTLWLIKTGTLLAQKALSIALRTANPATKKRLLEEAKSHYWAYQHDEEGRIPDTRQTLKPFSASSILLMSVIESYDSYISAGTEIDPGDLDTKIADCLENGSAMELLSCLYLIAHLPSVHQDRYLQLYDDTATKLDPSVVKEIEDLFADPGKPFFTTPPYETD